jgi:hypothetical protein
MSITLKRAISFWLIGTILMNVVAFSDSPAPGDDLNKVSHDLNGIAAKLREAVSDVTDDNARKAGLDLSAELDATAEAARNAASPGFNGVVDARTFDRLTNIVSRARHLYETKPVFAFDDMDVALFDVAHLIVSLHHDPISFRVIALTPFRVVPATHDQLISAIYTAASTDQPQPHVTFRNSRTTWLIFSTTDQIDMQIIVGDQFPFECSIQTRQVNPEAVAVVKSKFPLIVRADSGAQKVSTSISAPQLFSQLVNEESTYIVESATIVEPGASIVIGGKPCSDCPEGNGHYEWTPLQISVSLYATSCPPHVVAKNIFQPYLCGGGGTNIEFHASPTFSVRRRNIPDTALGSVENVKVSRYSATDGVPLPANWASAELKCVFNDGDRMRAEETSVIRGQTNQSTLPHRYWEAGVTNDVLRITTR